MRFVLTLALVAACGRSRAPHPPSAATPSATRCDELVEHVVDLAWLAHASKVAEGHGMVGTWNDGYAEERHEYKKELRAAHAQALSERCLRSSTSRVD